MTSFQPSPAENLESKNQRKVYPFCRSFTPPSDPKMPHLFLLSLLLMLLLLLLNLFPSLSAGQPLGSLVSCSGVGQGVSMG